MKRILAVIALVTGISGSAPAQTRTLTYQGCGDWGCASFEFTGTLAYGARWWNNAFDASTPPDQYQWLYRGSWGVVEQAPPGLTMRTDQWLLSGDPNEFHLFPNPDFDSAWQGAINGQAYIFADLVPSSAIAGRIETCASPGSALCLGGYTNYGGATLNLVSVTTTPEAGSFVLLATGLLAIGALPRRQSRRA